MFVEKLIKHFNIQKSATFLFYEAQGGEHQYSVTIYQLPGKKPTFMVISPDKGGFRFVFFSAAELTSPLPFSWQNAKGRKQRIVKKDSLSKFKEEFKQKFGLK